MDMELGMELVLEANLPMCECNNCFMGSFLQMMRYKGVRLSELEVQLPMPHKLSGSVYHIRMGSV